MNDVPEKQPRIRWKFRHILLMLLPGFVFLISYPLIHIACDKFYQAIPRTGPAGISNVIQAALSATAIAGILAGTTLTFMVPAVLRNAAAGGKLTSSEVSLAGFVIVVLNTGFVFGGCSLGDRVMDHVHRSASPRANPPPVIAAPEVWRASTDHGDKPGIGIEIRRQSGTLSCSMYLLDPSSPHDFTKGHECPAALTSISPEKLEFTVNWNGVRTDHLRLDLPAGIKGTKFHGLLSIPADKAPPDSYEFHLLTPNP